MTAKPESTFAQRALAVYVHWPYCARVCPYCDFNVRRDRGQAEQAQLVEAIVEDLRGQARLTGPRLLGSVFFGGGTPSLMAPDQLARVLEAAKALWPADADLEVSLEANPTDAEAGRFQAFAQAGVQRLSLGVQALNDTALKFLGRNHDAAEARRAAELARKAFARLSLDLIYALPEQTPQGWSEALDAALALEPEHVSAYQLTLEEGTAFGRAAARGRLAPPPDARAADLYELAQDRLGAAGFDAYEVSNHARGEAARSRHNLAYWRGGDYVGAGPGAHGRLTQAGVRTATVAAARPGDYIAQVKAAGVGFEAAEVLSPHEAALERLLMGLRIDQGVAWDEVAALGLGPDHPHVADLVAQGLLAADRTRLAATRAGRQLLDSLVAVLAG